jgi:hypothetical protein
VWVNCTISATDFLGLLVGAKLVVHDGIDVLIFF